jgi:hypothetical protein
MKAIISGLGGWLPPEVVSNACISSTLDTTPEWIETRTGIRERRKVTDGLSTRDLAVKAQISQEWSAEINYVGTRSTNLDTLTDLNQPTIVNGVSTGVKPYPNFGFIEFTNQNGYGYYNGLEATLNRRFRNGLSLRAAYTYSRSTDNTPAELEANSGFAPNGQNYKAWYGPSDFDVPHRIAVSYVYELPFGHGKTLLHDGVLAKVLGGFRTSGVYTYYSGHPFTINEGGALTASLDPFGEATSVPNVVGTPQIVGSPDCWFFAAQNKACRSLAPGLANAFQLTAPGHVGNSGRNTLRGPSTNVLDFALTRQFSVTEKTKLEFRWEVFNLTNNSGVWPAQRKLQQRLSWIHHHLVG